MIKFPHDRFGHPLLANYGIEQEDATVESKFQNGSFRRRQLTEQPYLKLTMTFKFQTRLKLGLFQSWWKYHNHFSTQWMLMEISTGTGLTENQVMLDPTYKLTQKSDQIFEVSVGAVCREPKKYSKLWTDFYLKYGVVPDATINKLDILVNRKLPTSITLETY